MSIPSGFSAASDSRAMLLRQSVSVPNTSKNKAFTTGAIRPSRLGEAPDSRTRLLHPLGLDDIRCARAGQRLDQGLGDFIVLGADGKASRIGRVVLNFARQWANQRDPWHRQNLADLVDTQL